MNVPFSPGQTRPLRLDELARAVVTREDFVEFASALHRELESHPDEWENNTLPRYLDGLAAWAGSMEGYFRNIGQPVPDQPSWKLMAELLLAATMYE